MSKKIFEAVAVFDQHRCPPITRAPDLQRFIAIQKEMIRSFRLRLTKGAHVIRERDTFTKEINLKLVGSRSNIARQMRIQTFAGTALFHKVNGPALLRLYRQLPSLTKQL